MILYAMDCYDMIWYIMI